MKNAILLHGWNAKKEFLDPNKPTASNDHWFPWLTKQLMVRGVYTVAVEMPNGYYPEYDVWKHEMERFDISDETIFVGHSCGGGFLVRWLSETNKKVGKVFLVAPWLGYGTDGEPFDETFFDFTIDPSLAAKTARLTLIHSSNDMPGVQRSVAELREKLENLQYIELIDKGHFTRTSLGTDAFPELLEEILR